MEHKKIKTVNFDDVDFYSKLIKDYLSGELKKNGIIDWDYSKKQVHHNKNINLQKNNTLYRYNYCF